MIVWDPNKAIDIGERSTCGDGQMEMFYCNIYLLLYFQDGTMVLDLSNKTDEALAKVRVLYNELVILRKAVSKVSGALFMRNQK